MTASLNPSDTIAAFLGTDHSATDAWAHLLAFDLLAGRWAYLDSRERRISTWIMSLVLYTITRDKEG